MAHLADVRAALEIQDDRVEVFRKSIVCRPSRTNDKPIERVIDISAT